MRQAWLNIGLSAQAPSTRQSGMTMKHTPFSKFPLPNFFMIGAAKSGTTALWHALRQHPDIHLSPIKEPCFFLSNGHAPNHTGHGWDFIRSVGIWRPGDYVKLFGESRICHAVGEASTPYLNSPAAALRIHANLPDSRIIAVLRQPAERAYSHFNFWRQLLLEPEKSFRAALADQENRRSNGWFPDFLYECSGYYHAHLQPWFELFPRERIRVFLYEEWQHHPRQTLADIFRFLGVNDNFKPNLQPCNVTKLPRVAWLHRLARDNHCTHSSTPGLWQAGRQWAHEQVRTANARFNRTPPPPLDPALRSKLTRTFRDDILRLEQLLDRDLSQWLAGT